MCSILPGYRVGGMVLKNNYLRHQMVMIRSPSFVRASMMANKTGNGMTTPTMSSTFIELLCHSMHGFLQNRSFSLVTTTICTSPCSHQTSWTTNEAPSNPVHSSFLLAREIHMAGLEMILKEPGNGSHTLLPKVSQTSSYWL